MPIFDLLDFIWDALQFIALVFVVILFFLDPMRRWNFFGYRPTAILGVYDATLKKVLLVKTHGHWGFSQGGIYENNIITAVREVAEREINLNLRGIRLEFTTALGCIALPSGHKLTRARLNTISLYTQLRGKGYIACYVSTRLTDDAVADFKPGVGIEEIRAVTLPEAKELVTTKPERVILENSPGKVKFTLRMLDEIGAIFAKPESD